MTEIEGVGEMATGAALARAVEPRTGERDGHTSEAACLNCREPLVGTYCHRCGQRGHVHRTISAWWHDFVHSVLHVDGKFWLTLGMLAWRPGQLTRRYAHGERAKFVSPLALFLFTVFTMFAVFSIAGPNMGTFDVAQTIEQGLEQERSKLARLEARQSTAASRNEGGEAAQLEAAIAETRDDISRLESLGAGAGEGRSDFRAIGFTTGWKPLDSAIAKANANPSLLLYKMQANAYKFSWALIPISVPFVWLLFLHRSRYRREFTGYDHLVFVTYSIAFMSLAVVALVVLRALEVSSAILDAAILIVPPLHMYRQLRGAYGLSRFSAAWRALALLVFAAVALMLFLMILLAVGVVG